MTTPAGAGSVYNYDLAAGFTSPRKIVAETVYRGLGEVLDLHGGRLATGPRRDSTGLSLAGSVGVFDEVGGTWIETPVTAAVPLEGEGFGWDVELAGDRILIGTYPNFSSPADPAACPFSWDGAAWREDERVTASDRGPATGFGRTLVLADSHLIVGAEFANFPAEFGGAAYAFAYGVDGTDEAAACEEQLAVSVVEGKQRADQPVRPAPDWAPARTVPLRDVVRGRAWGE